ncbi:unnamed protein product [Camellia sinensis]
MMRRRTVNRQIDDIFHILWESIYNVEQNGILDWIIFVGNCTNPQPSLAILPNGGRVSTLYINSASETISSFDYSETRVFENPRVGVFNHNSRPNFETQLFRAQETGGLCNHCR